MSWISSLDLDRALSACHQDLLGDWYRDPWGWPELDWAVTSRRDLIEQRILATDVRTVAKIDVPKENFGIRPAVVMDPLDRLAYQALVGAMSQNLIAGLHANAYGWRLPRTKMVPGVYANNSVEWDSYRDFLSALADRYEVVLKTDIVSCFASIPAPRLIEDLESRTTQPRSRPVVERLIPRLEKWSNISSRSGIPQRFQPSAVLANMYLGQLDDVLNHVSSVFTYSGKERRSFVRWMDDLWLFGDDAGDLRHAQVEITRALGDLGLNLNLGKTELLEGAAVAEHAKEIEHSAIDEELDLIGLVGGNKFKPRRLDELVERLVAQKEVASRTSIRFATTRMRKAGHYAKVEEFIGVAERMPQGADHLARLFRDSKRSAGLEAWYCEYRSGSWATIEWAAAQLATMFPSKGGVGKAIQDEIEGIVLRPGVSVTMLAVAAQRLAKWRPREARVVIADAVKHADNPIHRRVLALAGLQAGCSKSIVTRWLNDFPENAVILEMLKDMSFPKLPLKPDFG